MTGLETQTVTVGSQIAFEGFPYDLQKQAYTSKENLIEKISQLYTDKKLNAAYLEVQNSCLSDFSPKCYKAHLEQLHYLITFREAHRNKHLLIDLLWQNQLNKDKYFSKYIQYKQRYKDIKNELENS
ncbi:MAG: hypothetical protein CMC19_01725 [Flavobacteriaceae bacterium]|nr:hypothetical protein [Flavobacteriaceae bacterium]OUX40390.1 MAG: hypothetical protein CBE25_00550 [Flavobacteriaceae bacterium TMED265]